MPNELPRRRGGAGIDRASRRRARDRTDAVGELARQRDLLAFEVDERTRSLRTALDELRLASDAKSEFLANVSHELRTPLTSILGFAEILATGQDGRLTAEQARDIDTIRASSRHLLELIDDLIDISSIESGRIQLLLEPIDARAVVHDAIEAIRPLAGEKGIGLAVDEVATTPDAVPLKVAADRDRLREIVLNLLSNAVKFTPSGGSIRVSIAADATEPGPASQSADDGVPRRFVAIAVRDSGRGVAPADHERIFEKFIRIAGPETPGTGLGLSISRELARLHGGDLTIDSAPGLGSTFTLRVPLADAG